MSKCSVIGLDTAKSIFHMVEVNHKGKELRRKTLRRSQVLTTLAQMTPAVIAMESCSGAHYWARRFIEMGHRVKLLPAQHVKGYLRGQKNDYNDARAIAEACCHDCVRSVAVKTVEQQDRQILHRARSHLLKERNQLVNQIRGFLRERGVTIPAGLAAVRRSLPEILETPNEEVTPFLRELLNRQQARLVQLDDEIKWHDDRLKQAVRACDTCQRLCKIPGFGVVVSSAFSNWVGDGRQFRRGRDASAALGIVPRQHTSGGRPKLGSISKRGDAYLRCLVIHGARSVVRCSDYKTDPLSRWVNQLKSRVGIHKATVALANKLVRIAWVITARGENYRTSPVMG